MQPGSRAMAERCQPPRGCAPPTTRRRQRGRSPSGGSEGGGMRCMRGVRRHGYPPGGRSLFKGGSPHSRPQASRAKSSLTCPRVLPLRHGGRVPHIIQAGPEQKKPNRRARGACNRPAVTSTPPPSPKSTVERADRHVGGVQPHHGDAPLRLRRIQHGSPGPHVMKPARRLLRAKNCTATCANAAPSRLRNRYRDSRQPCAWPNSANRAHRSRVSQPREEARRSIWPKVGRQ
jgi:hypothetical protein